MARCKLSVEEQRKRRQRIDSDPDSRRDNLEKERQRWKNRVQNKKSQKNRRIRTKGTEALQEVLAERSRGSRAVQNARQEVDTPPDSPLEQSMEEPTSSRRAQPNQDVFSLKLTFYFVYSIELVMY